MFHTSVGSSTFTDQQKSNSSKGLMKNFNSMILKKVFYFSNDIHNREYNGKDSESMCAIPDGSFREDLRPRRSSSQKPKDIKDNKDSADSDKLE